MSLSVEESIVYSFTIHPYWEEGLNCPSPVEGGEILSATSWVAGSASTVVNSLLSVEEQSLLMQHNSGRNPDS